MVRATYNAIVRWGAGPIGSPSNFAPPSPEVAAATAYDDLSALVSRIVIRRGRADPYQAIGPGTCTLTLRDDDGWFVPGYSGSPLVAGGYLARLKTLSLYASHPTLGSSLSRFYGYLRRVIPDPDARTATLEFADGLYRMSYGLTNGYSSNPLGSTTSGVLLGLIGHRFSSQYVYQASANGNAFSAVASLAAGEAPLKLVNEVLAAERGVLFPNREGVWHFLDRHYHDRPPRDAPQSTLTQVQVARLALGLDADAVKNRATVTRSGGSAQTASATADDPADWGSLTTPYLNTDAQALDTARWIVAGLKDDQPVGYAAELDGDAGDAVLGAILSRDLHDRVRLDAIRVGQADYFIVGIEEEIVPGRKHTCRWLLQQRRAVDVGAIVGYSRVGDAAAGYTV